MPEKNKYIESLRTWEEVRKELFTPEELAASELQVALMIQIARARKEKGITQKKLEEMSGVRQPVIARMETGATSPRLDTVMKVLAALGKKLVIADL
ncbi:MAG: helix-turn-helix domain-containing protein [Turicibacter sp.]|nr:helix-turn-helix domain-containing protein [Turicibacter sp.]